MRLRRSRICPKCGHDIRVIHIADGDVVELARMASKPLVIFSANATTATHDRVQRWLDDWREGKP